VKKFAAVLHLSFLSPTLVRYEIGISTVSKLLFDT